MFFKLSVLFLFYIIAANSVLGEAEDENENLRDSFDNCRRWLGKSQSNTISKYDLLIYMGKNISDWYALDVYLVNNPAASEKQAVIDLSLYGELFKHLCCKRGLSVRNCAIYRRIVAASRSYISTSLLEWEDRD